MTARPFRSIASVLIQRTIVLAVLCMVVVFLVQSWLLRSEHQRQFEAVMSDVRAHFRPEFLNRIDDVIVFRHLTKEDLKRVVDIELGKVRNRLSERGLTLVMTDAAKFESVARDKKRLTPDASRCGSSANQMRPSTPDALTPCLQRAFIQEIQSR